MVGGKYHIDGVLSPNLVLLSGNQYRFLQHHSSNNNHPFRFSSVITLGDNSNAVAYTTGVQEVGTPGDGGTTYTRINVTDSTPTLYPYCGNHSNMYNDASASIQTNTLAISSSISSSIIHNTVEHVIQTGEAEDLKFFSRQTNTIYSPKLELRWDDHLPATGSNTGSLTPLDLSGQTENYVYQLHKRESYKETETIKFRFGARKRYIDKSFSTSIQTVSGSYFAEGSASYSILDMATNEDIIPFSAYTTMSCDPISPYFTQDLNTFEPNRAYKVLLKVKHNDGQVIIYDDDFEFILRS